MKERICQFKILKLAFVFVIICSLVVLSGCTDSKILDSIGSFISGSSSDSDNSSEAGGKVESTLPTYTKDTLEDWGEFESVSSIYTKLDRNLDRPDYVLVALKNVTVIRSGDSSDRNSKTNNIFVVNKESLSTSNRVTSDGKAKQWEDDEIIQVVMKNDTTNRVLHGDYITVKGVLDTKNKKIIDAEYEMIEPVK